MCIIIIILNVYLHQMHKNSWFNGLGLLQFDPRSLSQGCRTFVLRVKQKVKRPTDEEMPKNAKMPKNFKHQDFSECPSFLGKNEKKYQHL